MVAVADISIQCDACVGKRPPTCANLPYRICGKKPRAAHHPPSAAIGGCCLCSSERNRQGSGLGSERGGAAAAGDGWCSVAMAMPSAIGARREAAGEAEGASCRHGSRKAEVVRWRVGVGRCDEAVATPPVASGRREGCWLLAIGMRGVCSEGFGTD